MSHGSLECNSELRVTSDWDPDPSVAGVIAAAGAQCVRPARDLVTRQVPVQRSAHDLAVDPSWFYRRRFDRLDAERLDPADARPVRMAANSIHYLSVFDDHNNRPLYLGRTKRVASASRAVTKLR